jgi:hypothetical protein
MGFSMDLREIGRGVWIQLAQDREQWRAVANAVMNLRVLAPLTLLLSSMVKSKAVPLHAVETLGWRGGIAPNHSRPRHQMGVSGQRHAPAELYPGERTPGTHWTGGWVGPTEPVWTQSQEEKSFASAVDRTPVVQSVVRATPARGHI